MPLYLHPANLILSKAAFAEKHGFNVESIRDPLQMTHGEFFQEDNELISVAAWNLEEFDIDFLLQYGLHFNPQEKRSDDFVIYARYHGLMWETNWLKENGVYVWHIDCDKNLVKQAKKISALTREEIELQMSLGLEPFRVIV
jgi:hypothetical protein